MVIDVITYNGEAELFDLRYQILKDVVDEFIVVEFDKTFSGKDKPFYCSDFDFQSKYPRVLWCLTQEHEWLKYKDLAESSPNTVGAEHWKREFMMKESIRDRITPLKKDCLTNLQDDDIVYIGDCDEIWQPYPVYMGVSKLKLKVFTYYLNNRSSEQFWGPIVGRYGDIKGKCLNHLRTDAPKTSEESGWHFTSLKDNLRQKLYDSYTKEDYANEVIIDNLEYNINHDRDFLGRPFTYKVDESEWPQYLKENKERYLHLCKSLPS